VEGAARWRAPAGLHTSSVRLPVEGELPSFGGTTGWLNSPPLTPSGLRGKVVLTSFWTYTCINWLRQLPYLRAWADKYSGHGLVVIGVHTPEFWFERDAGNVRRAVHEMRIDYPVATDNERTENFASPGGAVPGAPHSYTAPAELGLNQWALSGDWTMEEQAVTLDQPGGRIACRFHARDLHLVMRPADGGTPAHFRVLVDGQPPDAAHGDDVDGQGHGTVTEPRLYQLIRQPGPIADRTFEISFTDPGVQACAFTFG
jgi:thiol-disulfide isomerase/thioredoxin